MRIKEVTHERVRNIGNYESVRVSLTACMGNDEDLHETLAILKAEAKAFLYPEKENDHDKTEPPEALTNGATKPTPGSFFGNEHPEDDLPY